MKSKTHSWAIFILVISGFINMAPLLAKSAPDHEAKSPATQSNQNSKTAIKDWLIVPVFYATNRIPLNPLNTDSYSQNANPNGLSFGVRNYAVPVPFNSPVDENAQKKMGWQLIHAVVKKRGESPTFDVTKCPIKNTVLSRAEIVPAFNEYRQNTGSSENIVYVHGCCAGFDTVMNRAAMVASHTQAPVIVYDWVSPIGFQKYLVNETMIAQTIDDFCKFVAKVETLMEPRTITFIGHSMGAELVDQAMVRRAELMKINPTMPKFKEIIMSNADVDAISFIKHGDDFALNGEKTRIYFSTNDKRLRLSTFVHGGYRRLGSPGVLIADLVKIKGAECIDITANNTGHNLPYWLVANMHKFNGVGPAKGFELKPHESGYLLLVRTGDAVQEISTEPSKCSCGSLSMVNK